MGLVPDKFQVEPSACLLAILCLILLGSIGGSQSAMAESYKMQIACQAWKEDTQQFLPRVLVLEQLPIAPSDSAGSRKAAPDLQKTVGAGQLASLTEKTPFRLRIYDGVSLVSNLPRLAAGDRNYKAVRSRSLSLGNGDRGFVVALKEREPGLDVQGQPMDYKGTGQRAGGRFTFHSAWSGKSEKRFNIFLKSLIAFVDTELGSDGAPEDGPYYCKTLPPSSGMEHGRSICANGDAHIDIAVVARDRALVRSVQRGLARRGFDPGRVDGILGPRTTAALSAWRKTHGEDTAAMLRRETLCSLL